MSTGSFATGPFCGAAGCRQAKADAIYRHPEHGRRALCPDCGDGLEVIRRV